MCEFRRRYNGTKSYGRHELLFIWVPRPPLRVGARVCVNVRVCVCLMTVVMSIQLAHPVLPLHCST